RASGPEGACGRVACARVAAGRLRRHYWARPHATCSTARADPTAPTGRTRGGIPWRCPLSWWGNGGIIPVLQTTELPARWRDTTQNGSPKYIGPHEMLTPVVTAKPILRAYACDNRAKAVWLDLEYQEKYTTAPPHNARRA